MRYWCQDCKKIAELDRYRRCSTCGSRETLPADPLGFAAVLPNVSYNGYHLPTLARCCRDLGSPTQGELAEFIWRLGTRETFPVVLAQNFMRACGYQPSKGFPLQRFDPTTGG